MANEERHRHDETSENPGHSGNSNSGHNGQHENPGNGHGNGQPHEGHGGQHGGNHGSNGHHGPHPGGHPHSYGEESSAAYTVPQGSPLTQWWAADPRRWEREESRMSALYPSFHYSDELFHGGIIGRVWLGTIRPWPDTLREAAAVLDRIEAGKGLYYADGTVVMPPGHQLLASVPPQLTPDVLPETYTVRVLHVPPPAHPKAWIVNPFIPEGIHRYPDGSICPLTPQLNEWSWERNDLADFLDAVSLWVIRCSWYKQTGKWIGLETDHLRPIRASKGAQCGCRSGYPLGKCPWHPVLTPSLVQA